MFWLIWNDISPGVISYEATNQSRLLSGDIPGVISFESIRRMVQRGISIADIRHALDAGEVIEDYPADYPYPSVLVLGWIDRRPLHVVAARTPEEAIIITVYEPNPLRWEQDYKRRKS